MTDLVSRQASPVAPVVQARDDMALQLEMANELARSDMLPKDFKGKPANVLIALSMGRALGIEPAVALYGFHVIEGRPMPSAELQASLTRRAGHLLRVTEHTDDATTVSIVRHDDPGHPFTVRYTLDDARRTGALDLVARWWPASGRPQDWTFPDGLDPATATAEQMIDAGCPPAVAKGDWKLRDSPWHTRPRLMIHHRAVTECVTLACPEIRSGLAMDLGAVEPPASADAEPVPVDAVDIINIQPPADEEGSVVQGNATATAPPASDDDPEIVDAEIVEEVEDTKAAGPVGEPPPPPEPEQDTRTVAEITGNPADAVFDNPPATSMPKPAAAKAEEIETAAGFKARIRSDYPGWTAPKLVKAMVAAGHDDVTSVDPIVNNPDLYKTALDLLEGDPQ